MTARAGDGHAERDAVAASGVDDDSDNVRWRAQSIRCTIMRLVRDGANGRATLDAGEMACARTSGVSARSNELSTPRSARRCARPTATAGRCSGLRSPRASIRRSGRANARVRNGARLRKRETENGKSRRH
jgi:hypothetical protein